MANYNELAQVVNSGQSRSIILYGNVHDWFYNNQKYVPLTEYLKNKTAKNNVVQITYELNAPIRISSEEFKLEFSSWRSIPAKKLDEQLISAMGNSLLGLELIKQIAIFARTTNFMVLVYIENADYIIPNEQHLDETCLRRIALLQDLFADPLFMDGNTTFVLMSEDVNAIHSKITRLPQVFTSQIASPNFEDRLNFIQRFENKPELWSTEEDLAKITAGMSLLSLRQLLIRASYKNTKITSEKAIEYVEKYIKGQLGEDVVEFKKPTHTLDDLVGFSRLKKFFKETFIPRIKDGTISGAAVAGPIGSGKTYIFEAVASMCDMPVLVLKNLRSQWYGQTDVVVERLSRVLYSLDKVLIFIDEADSQFSSIENEQHSTEKRLVGKILSLMSDTKLKGKVSWLLMTARIHLLPPDIRRPGRVGDLIIPVLDPEGKDRDEFIAWACQSCPWAIDEVKKVIPPDASAAYFTLIKKELDYSNPETAVEAREIIGDIIQPDISKTRKEQIQEAIKNCTRKSLLPELI